MGAGDRDPRAACSANGQMCLDSGDSRLVGGREVLPDRPGREHLARMAERPTVQQVNADRKTNTALMMASYASDKTPA